MIINEKLTGSGESDISDLDCSGLLNVSDDSDVIVDKKSDLVQDQSSCVGKQRRGRRAVLWAMHRS